MSLEKVITKKVKRGELIQLPSGLLAFPWIWHGQASGRKPLDQNELINGRLVMLTHPCFVVGGDTTTEYENGVGVEKSSIPSIDFYGDEAPPRYQNTITRVVQDYRNPMLIGFDVPENKEIDEAYLSTELNWLSGLNPKGPRVIYLTYPANPLPVIPNGWEDLIKGIKETFRSFYIKFGGSTLYRDVTNDEEPIIFGKGCLGITIQHLQSSFKYTIEEGYCFSEMINPD